MQPPGVNQWGYSLTYYPPTTPPRQQGDANKPQHLPQPRSPPPQQQPIRNRWGRALAQHAVPQRTPAQDREATTNPGNTAHSQSATTTAQEADNQPSSGPTETCAQQPPADADWGPPPWEQLPTAPRGWDPPLRQTHHGNTGLNPQPSGHAATTSPLQTEAHHPASSSHEQPPQMGDTTNQPQPNKGDDTNTAAAGGGTTSARGGIPPEQELEEAPSRGLSGGLDKPYHEGRGDQRMRGKRFKAAVQQAFAQRGWDKRDDQTWKQVAYMVDLYEDDDEEVWAKVLAAGPQRRPRRGHQQGIDWGMLLNLHTLPRGTVGPTPAQQSQPPPTTAAQTKHTAAGEPPGDPRRRREASSSTQAPQQQDEDISMWDGIFHVMLISQGGANVSQNSLLSEEQRRTCEASHTECGQGWSWFRTPEEHPATTTPAEDSTESGSTDERGGTTRQGTSQWGRHLPYSRGGP